LCAGLDEDVPTARHRLHRVLDEVDQDLSDVLDVDAYLGQIRVHRDMQGDVCRIAFGPEEL
jgi:hypothetical protein